MKKILLVLAVAFLLAVPGAADAADVGHVRVEINYGGADKVDDAIAAVIGAHPIVPHTGPQAITSDYIRNEVGVHFDSPEIHHLALPPLTGGQDGHNVVKVDHAEFSNFTPENIRLFLRHHDHANGENSIEISYAYSGSGARAAASVIKSAAQIPARTYAFVDENGENPSPVATENSNHLLLHIEDDSEYDHDRTPGVVEVHPNFAAEKESSGDNGGGGCDAGFSGAALLAAAGVWFLSRKRGA